MAEGAAWTTAVETGDGYMARFEGRCSTKPEVRLLHPSLDGLVAETRHPCRGRYGIVRLKGGWGLDLRRAEHQRATEYQWRCEDASSYLTTHNTEWTAHQLKKSRKWYLWDEPNGCAQIDIRFSLAGSRHVIDSTCGFQGA